MKMLNFLRFLSISVICIATLIIIVIITNPFAKNTEIVRSNGAQIQIEKNNFRLNATSNPEIDDSTTEEGSNERTVNSDSMIDFMSASPIPVSNEILNLDAASNPEIDDSTTEEGSNERTVNSDSKIDFMSSPPIPVSNEILSLDAASSQYIDDSSTKEGSNERTVNSDSKIDFLSAPPIPVSNVILNSRKCGPFIYAAWEEMLANETSKNGPPLMPSNLPFLRVDDEGFPLQMSRSHHELSRNDEGGLPYWPRLTSRSFRNKQWPIYRLPHSRSAKLASLLETRSMTVDDENLEFLRQQYEEQKRRTTRIAETCEKNPILYGRKVHQFAWIRNRDPKLVYCPCFKSASTTWMFYLVELASKERQKSVEHLNSAHMKVNALFPSPTLKNKARTYMDSLRFIVIRHPFTRFLSAYRDKIGRPDPFPHQIYFKQMQRAILYKYRPQNSSIPHDYPTFSEFVDYFIDFTKNLHTLAEWDDMVIEWLPFWVQCSVCSLDFQMVIKMETVENDKKFFFDIANLVELKELDIWGNPRDTKSSNYSADSFYNQLTVSQMENLKNSYGPDFEMFDYNIEEHLPLARDYKQSKV